jgi:hypothetical protein
MYRLIFLLFLVLLIFASPLHSRIIHVPIDSTTIQGGINGAVDGDTVLVADGTYTGDGNRDIDFTGKAIVLMSENGPEETIIDCEGSEVEPHRGFYFHSGEDSTSVLQGFTITNGWAGSGGGIYNNGSSPTITDCTFIHNWTFSDDGGGMFNFLSNPTVTNCTFSGNSASWDGGGMYNSSSSPTVTNCIFSGNNAINAGCGGGMVNFLTTSRPMVTNCTFSGNNATYGGGMYNNSSSPTVTNCSFSDNSAEYRGGVMYNEYSGDPTITNCILWGNLPDEIYNFDSDPIVTYSNVEGGYAGEGNINTDPRFVSFCGFDYLLRPYSPCVDKGDPAIEDFLYDWHPRWPDWYPNSSRSDMGAYGGPGNVGWLQ